MGAVPLNFAWRFEHVRSRKHERQFEVYCGTDLNKAKKRKDDVMLCYTKVGWSSRKVGKFTWRYLELSITKISSSISFVNLSYGGD